MSYSLVSLELTPFSPPDEIRAAIAMLEKRLVDAPNDKGLIEALADTQSLLSDHVQSNP